MRPAPLMMLRPHRFTIAIIAALSLASPLNVNAAGQATESVQVQRYEIPSQPLADAVQGFARTSRQQVTFNPATLAGRRSKAVSGNYSAEAALRLLLEGSAIELHKSPRGVWMLKANTRASSMPGPAASTAETPSASDDAPEELDVIVVTGTHIRHVSPTGSPIIVIDAEDIRSSGFSGTEQLIQALPQNFRGGEASASADVNMSLGSQRAFNMAAGSGANLRGLGANATLLLVNGRRISASSGGTFTDISMIPIEAIDRIEVFTDGASAVYGADAVGGVVNVILKAGYNSSESRASYGATTEVGREETRLSHTFGRQWDRGGVTVTVDHLKQSALMSNERDFTANVPGPTSVLPSNEMNSVLFNGEFALTDALILKGDIQYSRAKRDSVTVDGRGRNENDITPVRRNAALTLDYQFQNAWNVTMDAFASGEDIDNRVFAYREDGPLNFTYLHQRKQDQRGVEVRGSGTIFEIPGGSVRLAVGTGYKNEAYARSIDLYGLNQKADRSNTLAFAELHIPLVGESNARPGLRSLDLSLAARYDRYSDFGSTTNPRIGLAWSPSNRFTIRSSFSTSFRAPAIGEEARVSDDGLIGMELVSLPLDGSGDTWVPVLTWLGSEDLKPELSRNRSVGFDWEPAFAPGLSIGLTYYDIRYTDRIVLPPYELGVLYEPEYQPFLRRYDDATQLRALVEGAVARGVPYLDFTFGEFGDDPLGQTVYAYSYLWTNAQRVDMSGLDLAVRYPFTTGDNRFEVGLNASYIDRIEHRLTESSTPYDVIATYGNPPKLRARGNFSWTHQDLATAVNINYSDSYTDTTGLVDNKVRAYTTIDVVARYLFLNGFSIAVNVLNAFDEQPPYIQSSGRGSHYDPGNASPLGRMVTLQFGRRW